MLNSFLLSINCSTFRVHSYILTPLFYKKHIKIFSKIILTYHQIAPLFAQTFLYFTAINFLNQAIDNRNCSEFVQPTVASFVADGIPADFLKEALLYQQLFHHQQPTKTPHNANPHLFCDNIRPNPQNFKKICATKATCHRQLLWMPDNSKKGTTHKNVSKPVFSYQKRLKAITICVRLNIKKDTCCSKCLSVRIVSIPKVDAPKCGYALTSTA